jgi:hypothetical protein
MVAKPHVHMYVCGKKMLFFMSLPFQEMPTTSYFDKFLVRVKGTEGERKRLNQDNWASGSRINN